MYIPKFWKLLFYYFLNKLVWDLNSLKFSFPKIRLTLRYVLFETMKRISMKEGKIVIINVEDWLYSEQ